MKSQTVNLRRSFASWELSIGVLACFASHAPDARAASFDCAKASTFAEKIVCANAELSRLDEALNRAYLDHMATAVRKDQLRTEQLRWIGRRNSCTSSDCVFDAYRGRIASLPQMYKPTPGACYVQLKPTWPDWPYVKGGDYPVCGAVLANLNKYCDEPPQYNRRKVHPTTVELMEPTWRALDPTQNRDIVEETFTPNSPSPEMRTQSMNSGSAKITSLVESGVLKLTTTDIDIDSDGTPETVYMLENRYPNDGPEFNHPSFMIAEQGQRTQSQKAAGTMIDPYGDLFKFSGRWHSMGFSISPIKTLRVYQFQGHDRIATNQLCTIQHINDYQRK